MGVSELRYEDGKLSGLFIPIEDVEELKDDLKGDSRFLDYLNEILIKQQESKSA